MPRLQTFYVLSLQDNHDFKNVQIAELTFNVLLVSNFNKIFTKQKE